MSDAVKYPDYLVEILDEDDKTLAQIVKPRYYDNSSMKIRGNNFSLIQDKKDNVYVWFLSQNRIEKYGKNFKMIYRMNRALPYEESESMLREYSKNNTNPDPERDPLDQFTISFPFLAESILKTGFV